MGKTAIEWTDYSWNPLRMRWRADSKAGHYCLKLSPGCEHCYAGRMQGARFAGNDYQAESTFTQQIAKGLVEAGTLYLDPKTLEQPLHWRTPRRIFVCSMTDVFGEWVPDVWIDQLWRIMRETPQHTFIVLTKRPNRLKAWGGTPTGSVYLGLELPNVWLGVTVESDAYAWRAKVLAELPAAVRWVSAEPLLGPLPSLQVTCPECAGRGEIAADDAWWRCQRCRGTGRLLDWLVVGGESGGPLDRRLISVSDQSLDWVRDLRDRARAAGTRFFFKQWGGPTPRAGGRLLDGVTWDEYPTPRVAVPA